MSTLIDGVLACFEWTMRAFLGLLAMFGIALIAAPMAGIVYVAYWVITDEDDTGSKPTESAAESTAGDVGWHLDTESTFGGSQKLWTDMEHTATLRLTQGASASAVIDGSLEFDQLDDGEGLTSSDVEIRIHKKPRHGTIQLQANATATYRPVKHFMGEDEITYSLKLKGRPEVVEATYSITVELSPGGEYARTHKYENCAAARAAGVAPIRKGEVGYGPHLDADNDGVGCDWG
jgi:hypothetical protein